MVGLGSRTVEMLTAQSLIIHGPRASRLAKVGSAETEFCAMDCVGIVLFKVIALVPIIYAIWPCVPSDHCGDE